MFFLCHVNGLNRPSSAYDRDARRLAYNVNARPTEVIKSTASGDVSAVNVSVTTSFPEFSLARPKLPRVRKVCNKDRRPYLRVVFISGASE